MHNDYNFTLDETLDYLTDISNHAIATSTIQPITQTFFHNQYTSQFQDNLKFNHHEYKIIIGTANLYNDMYHGHVHNFHFVQKVFACFHEIGHLKQAEEFQQPITNSEIQYMAQTEIIKRTLPEAYLIENGYYNNINEIDAEQYGLFETRKFFKENFPEIDVDMYLVNIINSYEKWFAKQNISSVKEAMQNLEDARQQSRERILKLPIDKITPFSNCSPELKNFAKNTKRKQAYKQASENKDFKTAHRLLLDFIEQKYPWKYKELEGLKSEWTPRVYRSKHPILDNNHAHRFAELEAEYGDTLEPKQTDPENDFSLHM